MKYRLAIPEDVPLLARLNKELIVDEGHRNPMSINELEQRMAAWLLDEYAAVLFIHEGETIGYALYRSEPDHVYLRQFFVRRDFRRHGIGRTAMRWLHQNIWPASRRIRIDVLVGNAAAIAFWRSVGFTDYCLTMEQVADGGASPAAAADQLASR